MNVVFMGSPEFALPTLDALAGSPHQVLAVVTQPDRPSGRGRKLTPSPVGRRAEELGITMLKPEKFGAPEVVQELRGFDADAFVVVAFGAILRRRHLSIPRHGCLNVHPSLLPRHRGAVPIQATLLAGDDVTGVTTIVMDRGVDTGPILLQRAMEVEAGENAGALHDRLSRLGADLLVASVDGLEAGTLVATPQDDEGATHCRRLTKEDGRIQWSGDSVTVYRLTRAMTPWPGATTTRDGSPLTVIRASVMETASRNPVPGRVVSKDEGRGPVIACGRGTVVIETLKPAGSRAMSGPEFLRGHTLSEGETWGIE
jgi:methionyl-tRNA formyltransferase